MLTTQALIDTALARGLREKLPGEWFRVVNRRVPVPAGYIGITDPDFHIEYIGPDLTAPANLYELLRFADAVADSLLPGNHCDVFWSLHHKCFYATVEQGAEDPGPDRTTAVLGACAKALNIEDSPNANP